MPKAAQPQPLVNDNLSAYEFSSSAVLLLDDEFSVVYDNRIARQWFGLADDQPVGFSDVYFAAQDIQLSDREQRLVSVEQLLEAPVLFPVLAVHRNKQIRWLSFKLQTIGTQRLLEFTDVSPILDELSDLKQLVNNAISSDPLTRLYNRRYALERIEQLHHHAKRYQMPFTVAIVDIDHFKRINDTFGHQFGDQVLQRLAKVMKSSFRETDLCSRYGGEEFLILMPETQTKEAILSLDRLRQQISELKWDQLQRPITISCGVISWQANKSIEQLLFLADQRLNTAKKAGRNQVCGDLL